MIYPNFNFLKKMRNKKLLEGHNLCSICDNKAKVIHHLDKSHDNHQSSNLIVVCYQCHSQFHAKHKLDKNNPLAKLILIGHIPRKVIMENTGLKTSEISQILTGSRKPSITQRKAFFDAFGVDAFDWDNEK